MPTAHTMTISEASVKPVSIECRLSNGLPQTVLVGLAGRTVNEAKDRLRAAFASSQLAWPKRRVTLNLLPADLPKNDSGLDLGLAAAVLMVTGQLADKTASTALFLGEIGLNGQILPIKGLIAKLALAIQLHFEKCYLPAEQLKMASVLPGLKLYPLRQLADLLKPQLEPASPAGPWRPGHPEAPDLRQVAGQYQAKRALEIAAAGQHHLFLLGPPGGGKTLLARCLAGLLPPLTHQQFLEINQLHGLADTTTLLTAPPVREPHHTIRVNGLLGSQTSPPGELNLAHQGVLILNELPEFSHASLEALRQPLEDHYVMYRSRDSSARPADCCVVATANPCPCGFQGSRQVCDCSPLEIRRYQRRLSGPLLDRFDLFVSVNQPADQAVLAVDVAEASASVRRRVAAARRIQLDRTRCLNGRLIDPELRRQLKLTPAARQLINDAAERLGLSSRGINRCLRVARTIADLADSSTTEVLHLAEALQFRPPSLLAAAGAEP